MTKKYGNVSLDEEDRWTDVSRPTWPPRVRDPRSGFDSNTRHKAQSTRTNFQKAKIGRKQRG